MSSAPYARIAAFFSGLLPSGVTIVHGHALAPAGERDRLTVVAGRRRDHAAALARATRLADQIDAAAHLERAGRVVVLVLDEDVETRLGIEQRVRHQRSGANNSPSRASARRRRRQESVRSSMKLVVPRSIPRRLCSYQSDSTQRHKGHKVLIA